MRVFVNLLSERGLKVTRGSPSRRADLPKICKKMNVACEDELMALWLRMMPNRHSGAEI